MADTSRVMTGLFPVRDSAERACQGVLDRGCTQGDVDLVMSDETRQRQLGSGASTGLQQGGIVLGVRPRSEDDADHLSRHWQDARGTDIDR